MSLCSDLLVSIFAFFFKFNLYRYISPNFGAEKEKQYKAAVDLRQEEVRRVNGTGDTIGLDITACCMNGLDLGLHASLDLACSSRKCTFEVGAVQVAFNRPWSLKAMDAAQLARVPYFDQQWFFIGCYSYQPMPSTSFIYCCRSCSSLVSTLDEPYL